MELLDDTQKLLRWPAVWAGSNEQENFWNVLSASQFSILMLDYDGTLAPFHREKMKAFPYPGVESRLERIALLHGNCRAGLKSRISAEVVVFWHVNRGLIPWYGIQIADESG